MTRNPEVSDSHLQHPLAYKRSVHESKKLQYTVVILYGIFVFGIVGLLMLPTLLAYFGTEYSTNFDWKRFEAIQIGDSRDSVHSALGEPLETPFYVGVPSRNFFAARKPNPSSYWNTWVVYDENGVVIERDWRQVWD